MCFTFIHHQILAYPMCVPAVLSHTELTPAHFLYCVTYLNNPFNVFHLSDQPVICGNGVNHNMPSNACVHFCVLDPCVNNFLLLESSGLRFMTDDEA